MAQGAVHAPRLNRPRDDACRSLRRPGVSVGAKRILVTGAAGFIGSHVVEALLARGDSVVGFDNFDDFYSPRLKRRNVVEAKEHSNYLFIEGDLRSASDLSRVFLTAPFDTVVHMAARPGVLPSIEQPLLYDEVNVGGTTSLLEFVRQDLRTHFVLASSSSVYGATSALPFSESAPADRPASPYAATKRSNELACHAFHHVYGCDVTCLRLFTVYGPRQRPEMAIHRFTRLIDEGRPVELYGDGYSRRDFTYVADVVDGTLRAIDRPRGYRIFNLGTTSTTTLLELVAMLGSRLGREVQVHHRPTKAGDLPVTYADISRAKKELGYSPRTPLDIGLHYFVRWYRESTPPVAMQCTAR